MEERARAHTRAQALLFGLFAATDTPGTDAINK